MARWTISFFHQKVNLIGSNSPICTTIPEHSTAPVAAFCSSGCLLFWLAHEVPTTQVSYFTPHRNQNSKSESHSKRLQSQQDESHVVLLRYLLQRSTFTGKPALELAHTLVTKASDTRARTHAASCCNNKVSQVLLVQEEVSQGGHSMVESNSSTAVWDMDQPTSPTCRISSCH